MDETLPRPFHRHPTVRAAAGVIVCALLAAALFVPARAQRVDMAVRQSADAARTARVLEAFRNDLRYVPGELLIRFAPGSERTGQTAALRTLRTDVRAEDARWLGDVLHLRNLDIGHPALAAAALRRQPEVLYAQPNYIRRLQAVPNDPEYNRQWHMDAINAPPAWDINPGGRPDILVAVLDSGLTTTTATHGFRLWTGNGFQIFQLPMARTLDFDHARVNIGREFVFDLQWIDPATNQPIVFDADGHGTHVAGTIAQHTNNSIGFAGVAHGVTLLPLKVCWAYWDIQMDAGDVGIPGFVDPDDGGCPDDAIVAALRHAADAGAKVINISIGGDRPAPAIAEALRYAVDRGAFVSIAAGNDAMRGNPAIYPAAYAPDIDGVVAVGALDRARGRARYSSHGFYVELVAPGGDAGPSANHVWQMGPNQDDLHFERPSPRFDRFQSQGFSGTSMAAPHVAGVAALLYSQGITRPAAIEAALRRTARDLGPPGRDDEFGFGLIDARAALRGIGVAR